MDKLWAELTDNRSMEKGVRQMHTLAVLVLSTVLIADPVSGEQRATSQATNEDRLLDMLDLGETDQKIEAARQLSVQPQIAKRSIPRLIHALRDNDIFVRRWAVYALGRLGPAAIDAVPSLRELLQNDDFPLRVYAAFSLCQINRQQSQHALPVLIEALWTSDPEVQTAAARLIGEMGPLGKDSVPYLAVVVVFNEVDGPRTWNSPLVRLVPAKSRQEEELPISFHLPGTVVTTNAIVRYWDFDGAESSTNAARCAALKALGQIGPAAKGVWPFVEGARYDRDVAVRSIARNAMERIWGRKASE
jgi:hypothetical protein